MPEAADNVELYDLAEDPNERRNLVRLFLLSWELRALSKTACALQASALPGKVERLQSRLRLLMRRERVEARYSRPDTQGWPGRQTGRDRGNYVTGWCQPVTWSVKLDILYIISILLYLFIIISSSWHTMFHWSSLFNLIQISWFRVLSSFSSVQYSVPQDTECWSVDLVGGSVNHS